MRNESTTARKSKDRFMNPANSFLIALEVLPDLDIGVFLYAACIFSDELEIRRKDPSVGQIRVGQVVVLVRIAAQVVDHGELRLDVGLLQGGGILRVAEDRFVDIP